MDISRAIKKIYSDAEFVLSGSDYSGLSWLDSKPKPSLSELEAAWAEIETEQTIAALESAVDAFMDGKAQTKGFRDRHSFALRAGIPGSSWHARALVFGAWMDSVNDYCWQVKVDCLAGKREVPTVEELLAELPVMDPEV